MLLDYADRFVRVQEGRVLALEVPGNLLVPSKVVTLFDLGLAAIQPTKCIRMLHWVYTTFTGRSINVLSDIPSG